jgi:hypothetical protein
MIKDRKKASYALYAFYAFYALTLNPQRGTKNLETASGVRHPTSGTERSELATEGSKPGTRNPSYALYAPYALYALYAIYAIYAFT